jgi:hypothetical protein
MSEIESSLRLQLLGAESEIEATADLHSWDAEKQLTQLSEIEEDLLTTLREEYEDIDNFPPPIVKQLINKLQATKHYPGEPPVQTAFDHYATRIFLWDTELVVEVLAKLGNRKIVDWASRSLYMLTDKMREEDGFIPNMQYLDHNEGLHIGGLLERMSFKNKEGSDYTQPFLLPTAIKSVFEAYKRLGDADTAWAFLEDIYPRAKLHGSYFENFRASGPDNSLVYNIHPHEDGRDNIHKDFPERDGDDTLLINDYKAVAKDLVSTYWKNVRLRLVGWDPEKGRHIYGVRDVMFNSIIVKDTLILRDLASLLAGHELSQDKKAKYTDEAGHLEDYALRLEQAIYDHMWFKDDIWDPKKEGRTHRGLFRSLKGNDEPEEYIDAGDLMPLVLPNLSAQQLKSIINLILSSFNTNYGISGSPTDSPIADLHYQRRTGCNWHAVWPHIQKILGEDGLRMQADRIATDPSFRAQFDSVFEAEQTQFLCNIIADEAAARSKELTAGGVYAEMYDPDTGKPQRYPQVSNFGMAMQADIFEYFRLAEEERYYDLCKKLGRVVNIQSIHPPTRIILT